MSKKLEHAHDNVYGRPDLMAHVGQKIDLGCWPPRRLICLHKVVDVDFDSSHTISAGKATRRGGKKRHVFRQKATGPDLRAERRHVFKA